MLLRRTLVPAMTIVAVIAVAAAILVSRASVPTALGGKARAAGEEVREHAATVRLREAAAREIGADARVRPAAITAAAAPGFTGQTVLSATGNDWEPEVATDPNAPYVYILTTRYGGPKACSACPSPNLILYTSSNGGQTFDAGAYICTCKKVHAQNDPQMAVANDGTIYATWLNDYNPGVVFSKSTNHGQTWSTPIAMKAKAFNFTDKPWITISPSGQDVYIGWNKSDSYMSVSHNSGASFSAPIKTNNDSRYYFAGGAEVMPGGTIVFSETSFEQSGTGPVQIHAIRSTNGGSTWQQVLVDTVQQQPTCLGAGCPVDYYGPQAALAAANGTLVMVYQGATTAGGPQRMWARRSTDAGATWSARIDITGAPAGTNASFAAAAGRGSGDIRVWFMDDRNGSASWNTWYTTSSNGGTSWTAPVRISDATGAGLPGYKDANGFDEPYGDYGDVAITNTGKTVAVWSEGFSYSGPGGTWINRTT